MKKYYKLTAIIEIDVDCPDRIDLILENTKIVCQKTLRESENLCVKDRFITEVLKEV